MKKTLIIINVVLLLAVGALYILYFTYVSDDIHERKLAQVQVANTFKVAYFDFDTLENYYQYSKEVRSYLMKKDSDNQGQLQQLRVKYNNKIKEFNQVGASLTQTQQSAFQQQLAEMQQEYQQQDATLAQQMQSEYIRSQQGVKEKIQRYLKKYCHDKGFAYVFGTKEYDDFLYYKDTIRNITPDLIKGLNEEYLKEKKP
jgi:outer membrane protein